MPPETEAAPSEARVNNALEDLFNDAPPPADVVEEVVVEEEEVIPEEVEVEETPTEEEETETDYDAPVTESKAVEQAKIKGREAKELRAQLTEEKLERERIQKDYEETKARLAEIESTKVNPQDHPDYIAMRDEVMVDMSRGAEKLPRNMRKPMKDNFGKLMGKYLSLPSITSAERDGALDDYRADLFNTLGVSDTPYADLEEDERGAYDDVLDKAFDIIERNSGKTEKIQSFVTTLEEKAKNGHLSIGVKAYETTAKEFTDALGVVGDLPDEAIEASPFAVGSIISKMVKDNPDVAKVLKSAQRDVLEVLAGPRVYTQAELDRLQATGINIKEHNAERMRLHNDKKKKLGVMLVEALVTRADYMKVKKELAGLKGAKDAEESEFDALSKTTKKKTAAKAVEAYVPPSQRRNSALEAMLGG